MKKKIALVTGGYSGEAVISYKSANTIYNHLDKDDFDVYKIDISPQGWHYELDGKKFKIDKNDFSLTIDDQKIKFDVVFVGMHGTPGEDGKLQGYFDMLGIPYTSCNASSSALTFNKRYTVAVAAMAGIHVAKSLHLFKHTRCELDFILSALQLPLFIKPNNGGSSIGMSKVTEASQLQSALDKAFKEDDQVLVEEMISGREFTVGIFKSAGEIKVLPITEIITQKEFFDFEAKYQGKSSEITPAQIDEQWKMKIEAAAKKIYQVFNCSGVVRIDFIYDANNQAPYMLEINTVPGQSEASVIPQQVRAMGWELKDFYGKLAKEALTSLTHKPSEQFTYIAPQISKYILTFIRKYIMGRPLWVSLLVALVLLFLMVVIFMFSLKGITQHGVSRTVPSVTGKSLESVRSMLEEKGFDIIIQDSVYYDSLPPSVIVKQVPEGDAVVKVNRTVYVTINRIVAPDVEMPNLVGYSFRNAEMVLTNLGLRLGDTTFKPDFAKNSVLEQAYKGNSITAGTKIKIGSKISLVLGSGVGNEDMPVPKLIGLTYEEAKILMEAQGLILVPVVIDPLVRDTATAYVYKQNPEPKNEENRRYRIRPGQMMDIWLGLEKPVIDSLDKIKQKPIQED